MGRPRLTIEAGKTEHHYWGDLWRYRELFYFLSWRDILVRYKQTAIGVLWAVLRPVLTTAVFVFVFGRLARMPDEGVPYPLLVFAAMLPWQFFAAALTEASSSLVGNSNLISKIYFPRLIIPASAVIVALLDFAISLFILALLMFHFDVVPTWRIVLLLPLILLVMTASLGIGLWTSALNVKYRDFRYVIPFVVQLSLYVSPVGFSSSIVPERWRFLYSLNPLVGVIDGFRWAITGTSTQFNIPGFLASIILTLLIALGGGWYFRKTERAFADVI